MHKPSNEEITSEAIRLFEVVLARTFIEDFTDMKAEIRRVSLQCIDMAREILTFIPENVAK